MKKILVFSLSTLLLGSCATLTKTQINAVNQFGQTSKNFSAYPSRVFTEMSDIKLKSNMYYVNSLILPSSHVAMLDSIFADYKRDEILEAKVDITFQIIDKYAQSLLLLSSDKFSDDLKEQAEKFGTDIDSLTSSYNKLPGNSKLPAGIGKAVSQLIVMGGDQYIRVKQAKEIKKFIPKADTLIAVMTKNLLIFLGDSTGRVTILLDNLDSDLKENYKLYLSAYSRRNLFPQLENEFEYISLKNKLSNVRKLKAETIEATKSLRGAHKKLLSEIEKKKSLKETIEELQTFYQDVSELKKTMQSMN